MGEINGLPAHVLLIHFVVIVVPLAALCALLAVAWPAARRRLGIVTPLIALAALVSVPLTTEAGEWLEERVAETPFSATRLAGDGRRRPPSPSARRMRRFS